MKQHTLILIPIVVFLTACATSTDPHEGGFLGGVQGLSSGEYDSRINERQARLDRMKQEQAALDNEKKSLTQNKSSLEKKIRQEKQQLAKLKKKNRSLETKIAQLNKDNDISKKEMDALNQRSKQLTQDLQTTSNSLDALEGNASGGSSVDKQRKQLEAQRRELENEYQLLLDMTLELGQ